MGLLAISIVAASRLCRGEKALCRDKDVLDFSITCAAQVSFGTFFKIARLGVASGLALGWSWLVAFLAARNRVPQGASDAGFIPPPQTLASGIKRLSRDKK